MIFESEGLLIVAFYIWLPPTSYVVFLTTLVDPIIPNKRFSSFINVLFFMCVTEIVKITPNVTEVVLLLFQWTRLTRDL